MENNKPAIAITMGDPAGIGPEIGLKALASQDVYDRSRPLIVGDAKVLQRAKNDLGLPLDIHKIQSVSEALFRPGTVDVYDLDHPGTERITPGEISALAGAVAFDSVVTAIELAKAGSVDATVTGPIHKKSINEAGHHFAGHTEIYAHYTGTRRFAMLLAEENFRVIHVSTHVSLRQACDMVTTERVLEVIQLLDGGLRQLGILHGRIGVAGLNPHAGDSGLFGDEEIREIIPAIQEAQRQGYRVEGPVSPDTMFSKAIAGYYDGCVAMYHDQGHIPFKVAGFTWDQQQQKMKSVKGVNITLGLPIIRTSVDHGTAFDIAGKNIASPDAMLLAIDYAVRLARHKNSEK
jgi:4-hydroxythreonine-4-phosphate dehydrogenase